ncbi:tetratricopeptide repeat protein [Marinicellulosiphila megalodicopiae]|uniref:tetratricopeptide repeat protein n=1 Tax=Marinicellulosiphila megalodicopiae TaxID=2724896 RepID=UPI003BAED159
MKWFFVLLQRFIIYISFIGIMTSNAAANSDEINPAHLLSLESALQKQQFAKAWEIAIQLQDQYEGLEVFDFLYARAAIENKEYELAVFALNRVIVDKPNELRVHLEMGRALFFNNHLTQANNHFDFVLSQNPPENVAVKINQYKQAIDSILNQRATTYFKSASFLMGATNNVNSAPDDHILTATNNIIGLTEVTKQRSDAFINIVGTIGVIKPLDATSTLKANTSLSIKQGNDSEGLSNQVTLSGALTYTKTINAYTFSPFTQISLNNSNHDFSGAGLILGIAAPYKITQKLFFNGSSNFSINTDSNSEIANTNFSINSTLTYANPKHQNTASFTIMSLSLKEQTLAHNAFNALNISYILNSTLSTKFKNTALLSVMGKSFKDSDPIFLDPDDSTSAATRADAQVVFSNQLSFHKSEKSQYFAKLNAMKQFSNIEIYKLTKFDFSVGMNLTF